MHFHICVCRFWNLFLSVGTLPSALVQLKITTFVIADAKRFCILIFFFFEKSILTDRNERFYTVTKKKKNTVRLNTNVDNDGYDEELETPYRVQKSRVSMIIV